MAVVEKENLETEANVAASTASGRDGFLRRWWGRLPRFEAIILALGLLCNLYGKYFVLRRRHGEDVLSLLVQVSLIDVVFFGGAVLLIGLIHAYCHWKLSSRLGILIALVISGWSVANMAWLIATGVQVHVGVLASLIRDPREFGPIVLNSLVNRPRFSVPLGGAAFVFSLVILWRLVRPEPVRRTRRRFRLESVAVVLLMAIALGAMKLTDASISANPQHAALSYSSHWFGLTSMVGGSAGTDDALRSVRRIPREGEREIGAPPGGTSRPHVVIVMLESVAYWGTSFGGQPENQTPTLTRLAAEGVFFENTRTVVTHTTQSQFALLTGGLPSLNGGFAEAVLVDRPYETLATILRGRGYRTRFSQMVRATFECNPGLVANLGFESFWAREDLQDPSTHLGYFAGDDFKMIEPAFEWFDEQDDPCFMFFMTSVAHHPYEVPTWYGPPIEDEREAYLQSVRFTDDFLKGVVSELEKRGIYDDTLLCVIADHGEGFGEYDIFQHGSNPYEEALRIPWVLTWPERLEGGRVVAGLCSELDVTPTLLALLGFDVSRAEFKGLDALSQATKDRRILFSGWDMVDPTGYIEGDEKVVCWPQLGRVYRYDLSKDPAEKHPVLVDEDEAESIERKLTAWRLNSRITFEPKRYRERLLFDHWRTFSLGNTAWCYFVPPVATDTR